MVCLYVDVHNQKFLAIFQMLPAMSFVCIHIRDDRIAVHTSSASAYCIFFTLKANCCDIIYPLLIFLCSQVFPLLSCNFFLPHLYLSFPQYPNLLNLFELAQDLCPCELQSYLFCVNTVKMVKIRIMGTI